MSSAQHTRQTRKIKQLKSFEIDRIKAGGKEEKKLKNFRRQRTTAFAKKLKKDRKQ